MSAPTPRTHLLSDDDLACIAHQGAPMGLREDLIQLDGQGKVIFTMRGIQFYKHALDRYDIDLKLGALRTEADVHRVHKALGAAAFRDEVARRADDDARTGRQPARWRALDVITHAAGQLQEASVEPA